MSNARKLWMGAAALIILALGLPFTSPGHRVLQALGFTAACSTSDGDC